MDLRIVPTTDEPTNDKGLTSPSSEASGPTLGSGRKNGGPKENGHSILNSVSKIVSQIKKPPHRRSGSPLNWFPRKKTDSFLKRKIRLLQENGGMNLTLDETLGNANPHYTRIAREKIEASEAATKAMEARKAAMVEASWCRILRAARIQSNEAEAKLEEAEKSAAEAFEAARAKGVMMYDRPDCPQRPCEIESSSATGGGSTHTVTASFETAFEVDKEVMAAVKKAFIHLANCPSSSNKEEFKDLLWKISQNPDIGETHLELSETSPACEYDASSSGDDAAVDGGGTELKQRKYKGRQLFGNGSSKSFTGLINAMHDRLKSLKEDDLASLATVVATCGLNAALLEAENSKYHEFESVVSYTLDSTIRQGTAARRNSSVNRCMDGCSDRKEAVTAVPSLDKFLVKRISRLEREVQEARNSRCQETSTAPNLRDVESESASSESASDLGSILVKHVSKLQKEIQEAKKSQKQNTSFSENGSEVAVSECTQGKACKELGNSYGSIENMQQPDVELQETVSSHPYKENIDSNTLLSSSFTEDEEQSRKFGEIANGISSGIEVVKEDNSKKRSPVKRISRIERAKLEVLKAFSCEEQTGLDKILVKPVRKLEREKMQALERGSENATQRDHKKQGSMPAESLDKILVRHVSRLEKEKLAFGTKEDLTVVKKKDLQLEKMQGLDEILVKHQSKLEKAKLAAVHQPADDIIKHRKHQTDSTAIEGLDKILVKHQPDLEKAKVKLASQQSGDYIKHVDARKEARERELQQAWGGLSLGNSFRPHLSRLQRDTAAWKKAEEEERIQARRP